MVMKTNVGFVADFPTDRIDDDPEGKELANFIATTLANAGFEVDGPHAEKEWAWDLRSEADQLTVTSVVGLVDDMESKPPRQWLITNECHIGFVNRIWGGRSLEERRQRTIRRVCEALHQAMRSDPRFSHILWYDRETMDKPGDRPSIEP
jgi:hypothetical protein